MEGKGWGVLADKDIMPRTFVMEYIGVHFPCMLWPVPLCTCASACTPGHERVKLYPVFAGEIVDVEEAERRAQEYERQGLQHTYVMDLTCATLLQQQHLS